MDAIERLRSTVRTAVRQFARGLHVASRGNITPNMVTLAGLTLHGVVVWLIVGDYLVSAGITLVIFGLFDALDGELARLQHRVSPFGMVLDATTDRIKEGMVLGAIGYRFALDGRFELLTLSLAVLVLAYGISYVKAKGETVVAAKHSNPQTVNRRYQEGLARFEIRVTLIAAGLLSGWLAAALWLLLVLNLWTFVERSIRINADIKHGTD